MAAFFNAEKVKGNWYVDCTCSKWSFGSVHKGNLHYRWSSLWTIGLTRYQESCVCTCCYLEITALRWAGPSGALCGQDFTVFCVWEMVLNSRNEKAAIRVCLPAPLSAELQSESGGQSLPSHSWDWSILWWESVAQRWPRDTTMPKTHSGAPILGRQNVYACLNYFKDKSREIDFWIILSQTVLLCQHWLMSQPSNEGWLVCFTCHKW